MKNGEKKKSKAWQIYQERVRALFQQMKLNADVDVEVVGVRGKHQVDVYVTFIRYGIRTVWIVECKYWKQAVTKEKVLVLQQIVQDLGADKGFLFSEKGFQSGAVAYAKSSNIILTDINKVMSAASEELKELEIQNHLDTIEILINKLDEIPYRIESKIEWIEGKPSAYIEGIAPRQNIEILGRLLMFEHNLKRVKRGSTKSLIIGIDSKGKRIRTDDYHVFTHHLYGILKEANEHYEQYKNFMR